MTKSEEKAIAELVEIVGKFIKGASELQDKQEERIVAVENRLDKKFTPLNFEQEILRKSQESIGTAIQSVLTGYSSPLTKLVESVVSEQSSYLREIISESLATTIKKEEFKNAVNEAFAHKIAKNLVSGADSLFSKTMNELKQDAIFKSKMIMAVEKIVNETLKKD